MIFLISQILVFSVKKLSFFVCSSENLMFVIYLDFEHYTTALRPLLVCSLKDFLKITTNYWLYQLLPQKCFNLYASTLIAGFLSCRFLVPCLLMARWVRWNWHLNNLVKKSKFLKKLISSNKIKQKKQNSTSSHPEQLLPQYVSPSVSCVPLGPNPFF